MTAAIILMLLVLVACLSPLAVVGFRRLMRERQIRSGTRRLLEEIETHLAKRWGGR